MDPFYRGALPLAPLLMFFLAVGCTSPAREFSETEVVEDSSVGGQGKGGSETGGSDGTGGDPENTGGSGTGGDLENGEGGNTGGDASGGNPECEAMSDCGGTTPYCHEEACVACEPGLQACADGGAQLCNAEGTWESLNSCVADGSTCEGCVIDNECDDASECGDGACLDGKCTACVPDDRNCNGGSNTPRICDDSGSWTNEAECTGDAPICEQGGCIEEDCQGCRVNGECIEEGAVDPENICQACDSAESQDSWSGVEAAGSSCSSSPSTTGSCLEGLCECEDGWTGPDCDQCVVYVQPPAFNSNDGLSWLYPKGTVTEGLDLAEERLSTDAVTSCQLWVGRGSAPHHPSDPADSTIAFDATDPSLSEGWTFLLRTGVDVYGGFAGSERALSERDWKNNPTVLSGDLAEDDVTGNFTEQRGDNVLHVVTGADRARLDGFVIRGGHASDGNIPREYGGGILNDGTSPTLVNCSFIDNYAENCGAAVFNSASSSVIENCTFEGNSAGDENAGSVGTGGGICNQDGAVPVIKNCSFTGNVAWQGGGAIINIESNPTIQDCVFDTNIAPSPIGSAGAIYSFESAATITDCTFSANTATTGGGAILLREPHENGIPVVIRRSTFTDNSTEGTGGAVMIMGGVQLSLGQSSFNKNVAVESGGALYVSEGDEQLVSSCEFLENEGGVNGGAIMLENEAALTVSNSLLAKNTANYGGGISTTDGSTLTLQECTVAENEATDGGGGIVDQGSTTTIENSILWGNTPGDIQDSGTLTITYSVFPNAENGDTNSNSNPLFVNTTSENYHLKVGSPAIDFGDEGLRSKDFTDVDGDDDLSEETPFDLDGQNRVSGGSIDAGAYEHQGN